MDPGLKWIAEAMEASHRPQPRFENPLEFDDMTDSACAVLIKEQTRRQKNKSHGLEVMGKIIQRLVRNQGYKQTAEAMGEVIHRDDWD